MQTSVLIYEDNKTLRESLEQLIGYSEDFTVIGSYPNAVQAERQVERMKPGIILMDIDMPGGVTGIEAIKKIRAFDQQVPIIMLTVFDDNNNVLDSICAGASGYLLKKHLSDRLIESMKEVLEGGAPMSPAIARMVIASMQRHPSTEPNKFQLTSREMEILAALSQGEGYKAIAANYYISLNTVRTHIKNMYRKLQVNSQLEAIAKARNERLI
jgi:DNA-binding NarL/FixJ family response regulator